MSAEYPYPCCRCGYYCVSSTCPAGQGLFGVGKMDPCPGLSFHDSVATCQPALLIPEMIGVGLGCCILARAIKDGVTYDFASLPPEFKRLVVKQTLCRRER